MTIDDIPWITFALTLGMVVIYFVSPAITPLSYTVLAPWMHASFNHLWQNLLVFVLVGTWVERRVGWVTFLFFAVMIPYLALYLPVVLKYGELSRGASGLTMALTGYIVPVLLVLLVGHIDSFEFDAREVAVGLGILLILVYLTADSWVTVQRFVGLEPRPDGVAVSAHTTGLVLGVLWFGWRAWRHELAGG
ncbi:rhomboid family intramembrane serine protease [Saliphagus sp. GCM10025317]